MPTTVIALADEPSETHSRRPAGSIVTCRASAPTSTRRITRPRSRSMTASSPVPGVGHERVAAVGVKDAVARLREPAQHPPHPRRPALEQRHRAGRAVPDDRDRAGAALDAARPLDRPHPPDHAVPAERDDRDVRLEVGGHQRDRLARRDHRQAAAARERCDRQAGGEELAAVHRPNVRLTRPKKSGTVGQAAQEVVMRLARRSGPRGSPPMARECRRSGRRRAAA